LNKVTINDNLDWDNFKYLSNLQNIININNITYNDLIKFFNGDFTNTNIFSIIPYIYFELDDNNIFVNINNIKDIIKN
jgi:hypothetical protein